MPDSVGFTVK